MTSVSIGLENQVKILVDLICGSVVTLFETNFDNLKVFACVGLSAVAFVISLGHEQDLNP